MNHIKQNLIRHVKHLSDTIGPRDKTKHLNNFGSTISYIIKELENYSYRPVLTNNIIETNINGKVVFGSHYDTISNTPGADDNASGVAVNLELARLSKNENINFVFYPDEEPPYFNSQEMGSYIHVNLRKNIVKYMVCLESVGYYDYKPIFNTAVRLLNTGKKDFKMNCLDQVIYI